MNRKNLKRIVIAIAIISVYLAFGYTYLCGALAVTYNLSLSSMDSADFEMVLNLFGLWRIPFIAFNLFLIVVYLADRFLGSPPKTDEPL